MRTQEENKKERKELKNWNRPKVEILDKSITSSGGTPNTPEDFTFNPDGSN